ncbi:MAG: DUF507 family protein [Deltaproteobacteria bacterium]|nr:DUF507 family protein [Deltaproteobacteria bacterium]
MKLTKEQVEKVSASIIERLKDKDLVIFKAAEPKVLERVNEIILANLRAEDTLDKEVEEILKSHSVEGQKLDYRKMFNMVKGKLARERGIIL